MNVKILHTFLYLELHKCHRFLNLIIVCKILFCHVVSYACVNILNLKNFALLACDTNSALLVSVLFSYFQPFACYLDNYVYMVY